MEQVQNLGASDDNKPLRAPKLAPKYPASLLVVIGLIGSLLLCDSLTGLIGLFPDWPIFAPTMSVASSICGEWDMQPSPKMPFSNQLSNVGALAMVSRSDAWIVGSSQAWGDNTEAYLMALHWNGYRWTNVAVPNPSSDRIPAYLNLNNVVAVDTNDVWSIGSGQTKGQTVIRHWDGSAWSIEASPVLTSNNNHLYGLAAIAKDDIWAVGHADIPNISWRIGSILHTGIANEAKTLIIHWDGKAWTRVPAPEVGGLNAVAAVDANDIWAVGNGILHWDGSRWRNSGGPNGILHDLAIVDENDIWAVGESNGRSLTEHWDGKIWADISNPLSADLGKPTLSTLNAVTALTRDDVWAVGSQFGSTPDTQNLYNNNLLTVVLHWDGNVWNIVPSPNSSNRQHFVDIVAVSNNEVWALGEEGNSGNVLIERFTRSQCQ